jgi:hypothetical protein
MNNYQIKKYYKYDVLRYDDDLWGMSILFWSTFLIYLSISSIIFTNIFLAKSFDNYFFINYVYEKPEWVFGGEYDRYEESLFA